MNPSRNSQTAQNLLKAFAGESQARNRYSYYAKTARKEGLNAVEGIFLETAENERQHAKLFYRHLLPECSGMMLDIQASYPVALFDATTDNLKAAADGEHEEWSLLYPDFARVAQEEGFEAVARTFRLIAAVEKHHENRYLQLLDLVRQGYFKRGEKVLWKCDVCGHVIENFAAPQICPVCDHPQAHFVPVGGLL